MTSSELVCGNFRNTISSAELSRCKEELERPFSQQHENHVQQKSTDDQATTSQIMKYISFTKSIAISGQEPNHLTVVKPTSQTPYTDCEAFANIISSSKFRKRNGYVFTNKPLTPELLSSITIHNPVKHHAKEPGNLCGTNNPLGLHQNSPRYTPESVIQNYEHVSLDSIEQGVANLNTNNSELQIE